MNQILVSSNILNILNTQRAWKDHYPEFDLHTIYTSEIITERKVLENSNIYVHSSLFIDINSTGVNGGVFCLTGGLSSQKVLFEYISFSNCSTNGNGGCIYISSSGNNIFCNVCVYHCGTNSGSTYHGQIYYSSINCTDNLYQVSGEGCGYGVGCRRLFHLSTGTNKFHSVNASESYCEYYSGMVVNSNSHTSYSIFTNNTATDRICIYFSYLGNNDMSYCNVFYNFQESSSAGTIYSTGSSSTSISDSVFIENHGGYLFHMNTGAFTVSNCHIGEDQGSSTGVTVSHTVSFTSIPMSMHCNIVDKHDSDNNETMMNHQYFMNFAVIIHSLLLSYSQ